MARKKKPKLQFLRCIEVRKKLRLSKTTFYDHQDEEHPQFDPKFPRPVKRGSYVRYYEHEVDEYMLELGRERKARDANFAD